jgi:hypothetical protein
VKGARIHYSDEELAWIKARAHLPRRVLHAAFYYVFLRDDVSEANLTALCKRKGWLTGRTGQFEKGQEAFNKGRKGYVAPGSEKGWFRKGNVPHTARGVGHESIDTKNGYVWIIVAERNPYTGAATRRVQKHKWLWERTNGPVPERHVLKCLDGDKTNTDPSNWLAVPRAMLPRLAGRWSRNYDSAPEELKTTLLAIAKLEHAAREARRAKKERAA